MKQLTKEDIVNFAKEELTKHFYLSKSYIDKLCEISDVNKEDVYKEINKIKENDDLDSFFYVKIEKPINYKQNYIIEEYENGFEKEYDYKTTEELKTTEIKDELKYLELHDWRIYEEGIE